MRMGMSLDSLLFLQEMGLLTPKHNKILDIGPQNVYNILPNQIKKFVENQGQAVADDVLASEIERLVYFSTPRPEEQTTLLSEVTDLTPIEYNSFDVCAGLKTEFFDLNFDSIPEKYSEYYDLVLNFGTTEHIINQWNCFETIHDATKVGGAMYHRLPATGYLDHGYFTYTPLFFADLVRANDYELLDFFYTLASFDEPLQLGIDVRDAATLGSPHSGPLTVFERRVPCFDVHVVLRKGRSRRFRCGLEIATAHAAVNQAMALRYVPEEELRDRLFAATADRDAAIAECRRTHEALEQANEALEQANRHLTTILLSTTWRATAPVRTMLRKLRTRR